nr:tetratricopeptide repeat protein [Pseudomarimonas arenosa]
MDAGTPPRLRARVLADLGITYALAGLNAEALDYSRQALALFRELDDQRRVSAALGNIGNMLGEMGDLEASREHYLAALELKRSLGSQRGVGGLYNNLADLAEIDNDSREAQRLLIAAIEANREEKNPGSEALSLINLAGVEAELGEFESAEARLQQAMPLIGEDALPLQASAAYSRAKLAFKRFQAGGSGQQDDLSAARRQLLTAWNLALQIDDPRRRAKIAELGVSIESASEDFRRALQWQREAEQQRASLESAQAKQRQAMLSAQYLDERRNRELMELRAKEAQQEQQSASQQRKLWLLAGLLVVLGLVAFGLLQRVRWRQLQSARLRAHVEALESALDDAQRSRQKAERLSELNRQLLRVVSDEVRRPALQVRRQAERLLVDDFASIDPGSGLSAIAQAASELLRTSEQVLENSLGASDEQAQSVDLVDLLLGMTAGDRRAGEPRIELVDQQLRPNVAVDGARLQLILREWLALARELHSRDPRLGLHLEQQAEHCRLLLDDPAGLMARRIEDARDAKLEDARLGVLWLNQAVQQIGGKFIAEPLGALPRLVLQLPLAASKTDEVDGC